MKQQSIKDLKADKDELESICYSNDHQKQNELISKKTISDISIKTGLQRFIARHNKSVKMRYQGILRHGQ